MGNCCCCCCGESNEEKQTHHSQESPESNSVLPKPMVDIRSVYDLGRELKRGQDDATTTYLCEERATGRVYVCKSMCKRRHNAEDLRREISIRELLGGQPNIVEFMDAFEYPDSVNLVMEFCSGGDLSDRLAAKGSYTERQAASVCRDVLTVVHVCHSKGVMHRNLRPENLLLTSTAEDAQIKATGFSLSVFAHQGNVYKDIVGGAYYVAPEMLRRNYGREIDVWSAGVILYILLCGRQPFGAEIEKGIHEAILLKEVDFSTSPWPAISEQAKDLITRMLYKDPNKRITAVEALGHPWLKEMM